MRIRCAASVEVDANRWDEDKGSDVRNVDNELKRLQRSKFDSRGSSSKLSTFLRRELVGISQCRIRGLETFSSTCREERNFSCAPKITIKDFKTSKSSVRHL